jgi:cytochrome c
LIDSGARVRPTVKEEKMNQKNWIGMAGFVAVAMFVIAAPQAIAADNVDVEAAEALAKRESCLKCHAVDKPKDGPAYKKVAAKYKDKPDAEERLLKHLRSGSPVKLASGEEEEHRIIKTKDDKEVMNLIRWILSR